MVLDELAQPALAVEGALGAAEDIVAVREETRAVSGGVCCDVEDVPDVGGDGEGGPLQ